MWAHANIDFPRRRLPWLATFVTSPNAHALHHTKRDDRRNFGEILLVWDRLFGTYQCPVAARDQLGNYGVAGHVPSHSLWKEQLMLENEPTPAAESRLAS
jgi:sterol desaturase/sphingolipid hydroxylase (fatty acid hydroxylase superfamily)